ncbi:MULTISPECIES: GNAT family N-acetyltransferase [unclassified Hyphomonas]|uniref:GNAT family N-acetyltransferase n=1 Tax=unclassified Hyphomonas TaxID=2630699 RepID=UPI000A96E6FF|nr:MULTISPECIES: GNAT family N-acetyltransferase [unclassified Hyphomonas]
MSEPETIGMSGIRLRRAGPADGTLVEHLTRRIWTGRVSEESTVFRETPAYVAAQLEKGGGAILLEGGVPVGSGRWVPVPGPSGQGAWMEIKRIGVLEAYRKRGFGEVILKALEEAGRDAGAEGAQLAVRHDQVRLVDFYAGLGYVLADDVELTTPNPRSPPPIGMRKDFRTTR